MRPSDIPCFTQSLVHTNKSLEDYQAGVLVLCVARDAQDAAFIGGYFINIGSLPCT